MDSALAQKHLNVSFVWLWIEVVDEEDGHVDFLADDHGCNLGVASDGTGVHTTNVVVSDAFRLEGFFYQSARRPGADDVVLGEKIGVFDGPCYHVGFSVVVRHKGDGQGLVHGDFIFRKGKLFLKRFDYKDVILLFQFYYC